jgi:hypothetical protein
VGAIGRATASNKYFFLTNLIHPCIKIFNIFSKIGESGGGISREQFIDNTAADILKRIPQNYDLDKIRKKYGLDITPTTVVLLQELERFNKLISTIYRSLTTLQRVTFF